MQIEHYDEANKVVFVVMWVATLVLLHYCSPIRAVSQMQTRYGGINVWTSVKLTKRIDSPYRLLPETSLLNG